MRYLWLLAFTCILVASFAQAQVVSPTSFNVPLTIVGPTLSIVDDPIAYDGSNIYTSSGIPFPKNTAITDPATCQIRLNGTPVPAQFSVLSRRGGLMSDPTKPIQWVLATFQVQSLPAGTVNTSYALNCDTTNPPGPAPTTAVSIVSNTSSAVVVSTGAALFDISKIDAKIFNSVSVNGIAVIAPGTNTGLVMRAQDDQDGSATYSFIPTNVALVETGPLRAIVQLNGYYDNGVTNNFMNTKPMNAMVRLTFHANSPNVEIRHMLTNNGAIGPPFPNASVPPEDKAVFRELQLVMNPSLSGTQTAKFGSNTPVTATGNELILAQRGAPTRYDSRYHNALHQAPNDLTVTNIMDNFFTQFANGNTVTTQTNTHFDEALDLSDSAKGISIGMRGFWQTFPKDLRANQNKVAVALYPGNRTGQPQFEYTYVPYFRTNIVTPSHCCVASPDWANATQLIELVHPETLDIANPEFHYNATSNHVIPGGTRDYQDVLVQFHTSSTSFAEVQRQFDAFNHPLLAVPTDTEYTSQTEATPMLMAPKRNWSSSPTIPASFQSLFTRADKLFQVQVDPTVLATSAWQPNNVLTCTDLLQKQGATFGGWPSWGNTIAGDDMDGAWGRENNHYVASGGWNLMEYLRDFDYRQFEFGQLRAYHNNTFGTSWASAYPSTYGLGRYESGFNSLALTNGAHYWPHGLWLSYLLTGSPEMLDGTPEYADYLASHVPTVGGVYKYINGGGGRIAGRSMSAIAMAYKVLGKPTYLAAINNWMTALINGEQYSISIGCPPGSFPNSISPASQPCNTGWSESTLAEGAMEAYHFGGLTNASYTALFQRMLEFFKTHMLLGGNGTATSYNPYEVASHWDSANGYNVTGFYTSRIDPIDLADPIMMYTYLTQSPQNPLGDTQFVGLAQQLFKEGLLWNLGSGAVNTTNASQVNPITCRSTQYPSSYHNKILGKWEDSLSTASFFLVKYFDAGGAIIPPPPPLPSVSLKANNIGGAIWVPTSAPVTLSWSVFDATTCTASANPSVPNWNGSIPATPATGSQSSGTLPAAATIFTLTCTGPGGTSYSSVTVNIGTQPVPGASMPNPPANFTATAVSPTDVLLTWDDIANNTGYKLVYYTPFTSTISHTVTVTIGSDDTSYVHITAPAGSDLNYGIRGISNVPPYDNSPYAYTLVTTPGSGSSVPATPTGLTAAGTSPTSVNLAWTDAASNEAGYHVQRRTCVSSASCTGTFATITSTALAANTSTYSDVSVLSGNIYEYRVYAFNGNGNSANSNSALATTGTPSSGNYLPANNASFASGSVIAFSALIQNPIPQSVTVQLYVRDLSQPTEQLIHQQNVTAPPGGVTYAHNYTPPAPGNYSWRVIVSTPVGSQNSNLLYFTVNGQTPNPSPPALGIITPNSIPGNIGSQDILLSQGNYLTAATEIKVDGVTLPASDVTFISSSSMSFDLSLSRVQSLGAGNHIVLAHNIDGDSNPLTLAISNSSTNAPTVTAQSPASGAQYMVGASIPFSALIQNDVSTEPLHVQVWGSYASPVNYVLAYEATFTATPAGSIFSVNLPANQSPGNYIWSISATNPTNTSLLGYSVSSALGIVPSTCSGSSPFCPLQVGVCAGAQQICVGASYAACTPTNYGPYYQSTESSCSDGLDNDCDTGTSNGGADCSDSDCSTSVACLTCGDNTCDAQTETCSSCSLDCGPCAQPNPNNSPNTGGFTGGGGGGGGGSGGNNTPSTPTPPGSISGQEELGIDTPGLEHGSSTETGNPLTNILTGIGHAVVSAVSADAAQNLGVNLLAGVVIFMMAGFVVVHFLGFV